MKRLNTDDIILRFVDQDSPDRTIHDIGLPELVRNGFPVSEAGNRMEHLDTLQLEAEPDTSVPPPLHKGYKHNFRTLLKAAANNDLSLVSARRNDGTPVALVAAVSEDPADPESRVIIPIACMIEGNPFEMFQDPTIQ